MGIARGIFVGVPMLSALVSMVMLIVVLIGGVDKAGIRDIYFVRLNTTNLVSASSTAYAPLINTIAGRLGVAGYYQSSLWNYCSGELQENSDSEFASPNYCSPTQTNYWFNPVQIIVDDLPSQLTFDPPGDVDTALNSLRVAQKWTQGILIVAAIFSFLTFLACIFAFSSRCGSLFASIIAFVGAIFTIGGAVVAQVLGIVLRKVIDDLADYDIDATLGTTFYILLWIAAGFALLYWVLITATMCCCSPRDRRMQKEVS